MIFCIYSYLYIYHSHPSWHHVSEPCSSMVFMVVVAVVACVSSPFPPCGTADSTQRSAIFFRRRCRSGWDSPQVGLGLPVAVIIKFAMHLPVPHPHLRAQSSIR